MIDAALLTDEQIAQVCHEANRGLQAAVPTAGIPVAATWADFEDQAGVIEGVRAALDGATVEELHESWRKRKFEDGWTYGEVKDVDRKTHPCVCAYELLDEEHKRKDRLFHAIVHALAPVPTA